MVTQVDMSMWAWKIHKVPPVDKDLQTISRGRESVFYRDDTPPHWLISSKWSSLNIYTYEQHCSDSVIIKEDIVNLRENLNGT